MRTMQTMHPSIVVAPSGYPYNRYRNATLKQALQKLSQAKAMIKKQAAQIRRLNEAIEKERDAVKRCKARMHLVKMDESHQKAKEAVKKSEAHLTSNGTHGLGLPPLGQFAIRAGIALAAFALTCGLVFEKECKAAFTVLQWTIAGVIMLAGAIGVGLLAFGAYKRITQSVRGAEQRRRFDIQERHRRARVEAEIAAEERALEQEISEERELLRERIKRKRAAREGR